MINICSKKLLIHNEKSIGFEKIDHNGYMKRIIFNKTMSEFFNILVTISVLAVALVLILGLTNMLKRGSANRSQKLMRLRVIAQFIAIILIMVFFYFTY